MTCMIALSLADDANIVINVLNIYRYSSADCSEALRKNSEMYLCVGIYLSESKIKVERSSFRGGGKALTNVPHARIFQPMNLF